MQKRRLGRSNLEVTALGFGCMGMSFGYGTVDVTTQLALEHDLNTLEQEGDVLQRRLEHVLPGLTRRLFATVPLWRFVKLGPERRLEAALGEVFVLLREVLEAGRTRVAALPGRAPATFLEAMILARDEEGRPFSDSQILGNAIEILLAGEDTTALTLSWAVHELCDAPAALAALQAEADAVPGGDVAPADFEVAGRLDVAGSIAQETMRLRPVAPLVILETNVATVLGDVALSVGQRVALLMRTPAVSAQRFADPAAFRPERWLEPTTDGAHDTGALMPFGSGPRLCPGRALALLEMRVALATLGASFDLERLGERRGVSERFAFTMGPRGLRIRLRPRASRVRSERPPPREATPTGWRPSTEAQNRERHGQFNCGDQAVARGDGSTARACRPGARAGLRALPFVADRAAVWRERVRCQHWS